MEIEHLPLELQLAALEKRVAALEDCLGKGAEDIARALFDRVAPYLAHLLEARK